MLILTTKDIIYKHDMHPIRGNTILEVEKKNPEEYRVTRGSYERVTIKVSDCVLYAQEVTVYPEYYQELLQRREEVRQLTLERDGYLQRIEDDNRDVRTLRRDNKWLKEQLEALRNSQPEKVMLPKQVAKAIELVQAQDKAWNCYSIFGLLDRVNVAMRNGHCTRAVKEIAYWVSGDVSRRDVLVQALVNDYTIEEPEKTDEDKFKDGFHHLYRRISDEYSSLNPEKRRAKLADHLNTLAREIYSNHK